MDTQILKRDKVYSLAQNYLTIIYRDNIIGYESRINVIAPESIKVTEHDCYGDTICDLWSVEPKLLMWGTVVNTRKAEVILCLYKEDKILTIDINPKEEAHNDE